MARRAAFSTRTMSDQQLDRALVRRQQLAEQPARAAAEPGGRLALLGLLVVDLGLAAPVGRCVAVMRAPPRSRRRPRAARGRPGTVASSSRWSPTWVMVPSWRTATRSASSTVEARWATTRPVVAESTRCSASSTSFSVWTSSADRVSSSTRTRGWASTARARASRWRWPPDRAMPCSPIRVSSPQGRSWTKPAWLTSMADAISSSVASARPRVRFSRALMEKSVGSSKAVATRVRRWPSSRSRTSMPSMVTRPPVTS